MSVNEPKPTYPLLPSRRAIDEMYGQQIVELDRTKIQQLMVERTIYAPI